MNEPQKMGVYQTKKRTSPVVYIILGLIALLILLFVIGAL